jgi:4-hydroxy-tetrahydrodipicolinate reductase
MRPIPVMVNGLPGHVARTIAAGVQAHPGFSLVPFSFTGPEIEDDEFTVGDGAVSLVRPDARLSVLDRIPETAISVDFTHPSAVNANATFYCEHGRPFVMGTTGGDRDRLVRTVEESDIPAVIAPNMAKQIVGFQAMMTYAAENFPGLFDGYSLEIRESHQAGKADTSGTAKAMVGLFNRLGCDFSVEQIEKERDPERQKAEWGIPPEHLGGHAWHTYTLTGPDGSVRFAFTHNINGREVYVPGALDAVSFLAARVAENPGGRVYTMIDVLRAGS